MAHRTNLQRRFVTAAPVKSFIRGSKKAVLPGFEGFSLFQIWEPFIRHLSSTNLIERSAAISFNVFMAIPPTLIFIFTLIPYLPIPDRLIHELFSLIRDVVPGRENNTVIIQFLDDFLKNPRNELLSFGLFLSIFFSSNAMMGLLRSFDRKGSAFQRRSGLKKRQTALKLTLAIFVFFFICLLLLIAQGAFLNWIGIKNVWVRYAIVNIRWVIILLLVFYSVSFVYRQGPPLKTRWPFLTPGSVFATFFMFLATFLVSFWVNNFSNYNKLYGSISAVFMLMSLIFINALVVLIGFELNVTIAYMKRRRELTLRRAAA